MSLLVYLLISCKTGLPIIPEPGTLMLLAVGWVMVALAGRSVCRRRAAAVTPPDR